MVFHSEAQVETVRSRRVVVGRWFVAFTGCVAVLLTALGTVRAQDDGEGCEGSWQEQALEGLESGATQAVLAMDVANNAYVASVVDGRIQVRIIGPSFIADAPLDGGPGLQGDPAFATTSSGITYMSFEQLDPEAPEFGRDVYLTQNVGGEFNAPQNLTADNRLDDHGARLVLDRFGSPHLTWAQRIAESSRVVYWNKELDDPVVVATDGDFPGIAVEQDSRIHFVFSRGNDIFHVSGEAGVFDAPVAVTSSPFVPESSVSIGVTEGGDVLVSYESNNSLYLSVMGAGESAFQPQLLLDSGGVLDPGMRVKRDGKVLISYTNQGDVCYRVGRGTSLDPPVRVRESSEVESRPSMDADQNGSLHGGFIRDGQVFYASNACAPTGDFTAAPTSGRLPLEVKFTDLSGGAIERWEWDFGDGGTSSQQSPTHVYHETGTYTVKLRVFGPGGVLNDREIEDYIAVQDPLNSMQFPDQQVLPGAKDVWFPVLATSVEAIQGFQVMATFDPNFLTLMRHDFRFTAVSAHRIEPDFVQLNGPPDPGYESHFEFGCLFETREPFEGMTLPPGRDQTLVNFVFDVPSWAPQGETTAVRLVNDAKLSRIFNIFIVDGFNRLPALRGAQVKVRIVEPPFPIRFIRGDFDADEKVNLSDAIAILNFLFQGGTPPPCPDAADVGDSGRVDISDAVWTLNFLFAGGMAPSVPYPNKGLDPTDDELGECVSN